MPAMLAPSQPIAQTQQNVASAVYPMQGETQGQFYDRANRALKKTYPIQNKRTVHIIRLWQNSDNDSDLRNEAKERFGPDKFTQYGPRCVFLSHTIPEIAEEVDESTGELIRPGREGTVYNRENIQHLVDYANYRIRNAGQFAALSEGHMPTMEEKKTGRPDADVLGYAGPFYIGEFGNQKPQWAIFCDEWVHNEDVPKAEKLQRRSPEVWCKEPIERRTMDPIAMLGSETPRLDSGMNLYARRADGTEVMRYSMSMALPGADNCYVPGSETGKPTKYGANEMVPGTPDPSMNTQPGAGGGDEALIDAIVEQVAKLMPSIVQGVQQKLQASNPDDPDAVPDDNEEQESEPSSDTPRGIDPPETVPSGQSPDVAATGQREQAQQPQVDQNSAQGGFDDGPSLGQANQVQNPVNSMGQPIDDQHQKYMAMGGSCGDAYAAGHSAGSQKGRPMTQNYSKASESLEARFKAQAAQIEAQAKRIQDLETDKRDTERYAKIHAIAVGHEIGDEAEHLKEVLDASDVEFDRYCKALTLAPAKGDLTNVEIFDDPRLDVETENYSRRSGSKSKAPSKDEIDRYQKQAADITARKKSKGQETSFEDEFKTIVTAAGYVDLIA